MAEASRSRRRPPTTESRRVFVAGSDPISQVEAWTGRPLWIDVVEGARWASCQRSVRVGRQLVSGGARRAPWLFPRLLTRDGRTFHSPMPPDHHGFGRPRRVDAKRPVVLYIAWARDVVGSSQREVATAVYGGSTTHLGAREIKRVRDAERDGRTLYRDLGILPWAAYDDARPAGRWWADEVFRKAVVEWQLQAITEPSSDPQPDPERAQKEAFDGMAAQALGPAMQIMESARAQLSARVQLPTLLTPERREALIARALQSHDVEPWQFPPDDEA